MTDKKQKGKQSEFVRWFAPLLQALKDLGGSAAPREALERIAEIEKVPGAAPIELVDGEKLFEMFKRYELGLKPRTVFDIDLAFFEQFR